MEDNYAKLIIDMGYRRTEAGYTLLRDALSREGYYLHSEWPFVQQPYVRVQEVTAPGVMRKIDHIKKILEPRQAQIEYLSYGLLSYSLEDCSAEVAKIISQRKLQKYMENEKRLFIIKVLKNNGGGFTGEEEGKISGLSNNFKIKGGFTKSNLYYLGDIAERKTITQYLYAGKKSGLYQAMTVKCNLEEELGRGYKVEGYVVDLGAEGEEMPHYKLEYINEDDHPSITLEKALKRVNKPESLITRFINWFLVR